ncbi:hypothetical protein [Glycomyces buryatensis]|uniref:Uncharacterized protein n=1 Tax=Glycomyces buryatensis TaxID=2570927 RepID=A0A4S8Q502_9ACTN|nr:hypothetical protein [Glycomyces buryatensis]THV35719.1 hypothetical protein FAB82_22870 [Glycomyces buryatensis]
MDYATAATEHSTFHWLTTESIWDADPDVYDMIARAAREIHWASVTHRPTAAAVHCELVFDYLTTGLIAATGAAERTVWIGKASRSRTKPIPHTLTGVREITDEGTRALLLLTGAEQPVPVAVWEQALLGPAVDTSCAAAAHRYCHGRDDQGRACGCRCGCRWPDRLAAYQGLAAGDEATDPALTWSFTVTSSPQLQKTGSLALEVQGADEPCAELFYRQPTEPVIVHNAWRLSRTDEATEPPSSA